MEVDMQKLTMVFVILNAVAVLFLVAKICLDSRVNDTDRLITMNTCLTQARQKIKTGEELLNRLRAEKAGLEKQREQALDRESSRVVEYDDAMEDLKENLRRLGELT